MSAVPRAPGVGPLPPTVIRLAGLVVSVAYATLIVWVYANQPRTIGDLRGGVQSSLGVYQIDRAAFDSGVRLFHQGKYRDARAALAEADRDRQDPTVQFYVGYSFYRQGWGRFYHNNAVYERGLEAIERAIALAPDGQVIVDDPALVMHSSEELRAELESGIRRIWQGDLSHILACDICVTEHSFGRVTNICSEYPNVRSVDNFPNILPYSAPRTGRSRP